MKKTLFAILLLTQATQAQIIKVGCGEYVTSYVKADGTIGLYTQSTITPTIANYTGITTAIAIDGGQYHTTALLADGTVRILGNQSTFVSTVPLDVNDATFDSNFAVKGFYECNVTIRGADSSLWYWGTGDPMNYTGGTITKPIPITMPVGKKFKRHETGANTAFSNGVTMIVALASDGTLWQWLKQTGASGLTTPTDITPAGKTVTDFALVSFYGILTVNSDNTLSGKGIYNGQYVGQSTHSTSWTNVTSNWTGVTFPIKEIASGYNVVHLIDAADNLYGCGSDNMGDVGVGFETPALKDLPYPYQVDISANNEYLQTPILVARKVKTIQSGTTIAFYHYVQDMAGNWYSWGRNKSFALANGTSLGPYAGWGGTGSYDIYPNAADVTMPKRVAPLVTNFTLVNFAVSDNIPPSVGAGIYQWITTPTTTLYGKVHQQSATITSTTWSKVSGPAGGDITTPSSLTTGLTNLQTGDYIYELSATNSNGQTSTDNITVSVTYTPPAAGNILRTTTKFRN